MDLDACGCSSYFILSLNMMYTISFWNSNEVKHIFFNDVINYRYAWNLTIYDILITSLSTVNKYVRIELLKLGNSNYRYFTLNKWFCSAEDRSENDHILSDFAKAEGHILW